MSEGAAIFGIVILIFAAFGAIAGHADISPTIQPPKAEPPESGTEEIMK
jgi:hypothetical protein